MPENAPPAPPFRDALGLWAKIGCLSFGGAAGQIAMMHRMIVDERNWLAERPFLDMLNFCTLLPGPEAQQLATFIGWRWHGVMGGLVAGLLFVIPGALVMLALSALYVMGAGVPWIEGLFFGIKAAVVCIVIEALIRIGRRALTGWPLIMLAVVSYVALLALDIPFPLVIGTAALLGAWLARARPALIGLAIGATPPAPAHPVNWAGIASSALIWGAIWLLPLGLAVLLLGGGHILVELGLFFSKLAVLTFGGAYAVLAWLSDEAVQRGWLSANEMIDGLGLAETTPGPTILVNQFAGFLAAWRAPAPFTPLTAGILGAVMTVWVTFAPSFLWIFAGGPLFERVRGSLIVRGALKAITAAVAGVIATLATRFAIAALFGKSGELAFGPIALPWPAWATLRVDALVLTLLAGLMLFALHRGVITTVATLGALGVAWRLVG